jgi:hypothetical protein
VSNWPAQLSAAAHLPLTQLSDAQSKSVLQEPPTAHCPQPTALWFKQLDGGLMHNPVHSLQAPLAQSLSVPHFFPTAHFVVEQTSPQSTSDSVPFLMVSVQVRVAQTFVVG